MGRLWEDNGKTKARLWADYGAGERRAGRFVFVFVCVCCGSLAAMYCCLIICLLAYLLGCWFGMRVLA